MLGLQRTAAAVEGWRRRAWPLTNSDLSRTGDDLRSDAEAIAMFNKILSLSLSLSHCHTLCSYNVVGDL